MAVVDVARASNVSEQTVYNYFPTKERLVLDREQEFLERFTRLVSTRPPGTSPAAALRDEALALVDELRSMSADQARGGLGYLAAISPGIRRLCLEMTDRLAAAIAAAIAERAGGAPAHLARIQAVALAWVFQTITDEAGRRQVAGQDPAQIAEQLRPIVEDLINNLDGWLSHA